MDTFQEKKKSEKKKKSENNQISSEKKSLKKKSLDHDILDDIKYFESIKTQHGMYGCSNCQFDTYNLKDFKRHLNTKKHLKKNPKKTPKNKTIMVSTFFCNCGNRYKYSSGLSKHKKKCENAKNLKNFKKIKKNQKKTAKNGEKSDKNVARKRENGQKVNFAIFDEKHNLKVTKAFQHAMCKDVNAVEKVGSEEIKIAEMMKKTLSQTEAIHKLLEQNSVLIEKLSKTPNVTYQNCGNKKMTINVFLNEKCKDAMNLSDFVNNMNISLEDLMYTKNYGYNKGISNIFVKHLKDLQPNERPIHCSDKKRMQFYVRDENKWLKDEKNQKIDKTIHDLTIKQIKHLKEWETNNPHYLQDDKLLTQWQQLVHEIMGPSDDFTREKDKESIMKTLGNTVELKNNLIIPYKKT
jgi:hypothetical protein